MANSGKITSSLWKMSTLSLLSLCVFFADQIVCFSIGHPNAVSSQLRPDPNSLEVPAADAELPAAVSFPSHSLRTRRELTNCSRKFKTLFDSSSGIFLSVLGNGTVRGGAPRCSDGSTILQLESGGLFVVRIRFSNGYIGVQGGAVKGLMSSDEPDVDLTLWCEQISANGSFQYKHFSPNVNNCHQASHYLKVDQNGDVNISDQGGSSFVKL